MAYNLPNSYKDKTPAQQLDKKTLNKMALRSMFLQASFNYERMQAGGWLWGILPGLKKIHKDKDDLAASMSHNLEFFNTHPFLVTLVMGIVLSLEQNKADIPTIRAVRVAAMGPLGGIGDALFWLTLVPIAAGITSNMAIGGNIIAPFLFLIIFNVAQFAVRFFLMHWSYKMGTSAIDILTENAKEFTRAASILGVFVVGALIATLGSTVLNIDIPNGSTNVAVPVTTIVQNSELKNYEEFLYKKDDKGKLTEELKPFASEQGKTASIVDLKNGSSQLTFERNEKQDVKINIQKILDGILPKLIPLAFTLGVFLLMSKKNFTPLKSIVLLMVIGIVGAYLPMLWGGPPLFS
ncbi:PTS system mannose/fructose/sorbose family transporter subunit IID [Miniphocaeibacter massiliensis]|uniref:PTS system mannose/fructose/sorbose family transporter subunit IID n=1 Tax=Miniphocaeibacter massiliensis TaxID=2041841 RepID=UPI000C1BA835|nr:PTS system mannose/fructose/sorbose family transporter subunit IID [Miniphocaeibacter massiliensis]